MANKRGVVLADNSLKQVPSGCLGNINDTECFYGSPPNRVVGVTQALLHECADTGHITKRMGNQLDRALPAEPVFQRLVPSSKILECGRILILKKTLPRQTRTIEGVGLGDTLEPRSQGRGTWSRFGNSFQDAQRIRISIDCFCQYVQRPPLFRRACSLRSHIFRKRWKRGLPDTGEYGGDFVCDGTLGSWRQKAVVVPSVYPFSRNLANHRNWSCFGQEDLRRRLIGVDEAFDGVVEFPAAMATDQTRRT